MLVKNIGHFGQRLFSITVILVAFHILHPYILHISNMILLRNHLKWNSLQHNAHWRTQYYQCGICSIDYDFITQIEHSEKETRSILEFLNLTGKASQRTIPTKSQKWPKIVWNRLKWNFMGFLLSLLSHMTKKFSKKHRKKSFRGFV